MHRQNCCSRETVNSPVIGFEACKFGEPGLSTTRELLKYLLNINSPFSLHICSLKRNLCNLLYSAYHK